MHGLTLWKMAKEHFTNAINLNFWFLFKIISGNFLTKARFNFNEFLFLAIFFPYINLLLSIPARASKYHPPFGKQKSNSNYKSRHASARNEIFFIFITAIKSIDPESQFPFRIRNGMH